MLSSVFVPLFAAAAAAANIPAGVFPNDDWTVETRVASGEWERVPVLLTLTPTGEGNLFDLDPNVYRTFDGIRHVNYVTKAAVADVPVASNREIRVRHRQGKALSVLPTTPATSSDGSLVLCGDSPRKVMVKTGDDDIRTLSLFVSKPVPAAEKDYAHIMRYPRGFHRVGTVPVTNDSTRIVLEAGAFVEGAFDIRGAKHVRLEGPGSIYAIRRCSGAETEFRGDRFWGAFRKGSCPSVYIHEGAEDVEIVGLTMHSEFRGVTARNARDIRLVDVRIFTSCENADGINAINVVGLTARDCYVHSADDCFAGFNACDSIRFLWDDEKFVTERRTADLKLLDSVLWTSCRPVSLGGHGTRTVPDRDVFENVEIGRVAIIGCAHDSHCPVADKSEKKARRWSGILRCLSQSEEIVRNFHYHDIDVVWTPGYIGKPIHLEVRSDATASYTEKAGYRIENFLFENIRFTGVPEKMMPVLLKAPLTEDPSAGIFDVRFRNVTFNGRPAAEADFCRIGNVPGSPLRAVRGALDVSSDVNVLDLNGSAVPMLILSNATEASWSLRDLSGATLAQGRVTNLPARIELPRPERSGVYDVLTSGGEVFRFAAMHPTGQRSAKHDLKPGHFVFGLCAQPLFLDRAFQLKTIELGKLCGCEHFRGGLNWPTVQKTRDSWDFARYDWYLDRLDEANIVLQSGLQWTPGWAAAAEQHPVAPKGMKAPDFDAYTNYVAHVAARYRGRIPIYEPWNEPDIAFFANFPKEEYVRLQQGAFDVIRALDPQAIVLTAGFANQNAELHIRALCETVPQAFDSIAYHGHGPFESYLPGVALVRKLQREYGLKQSWWANETAVNGTDERMLAETLVKKLVYSWANGAAGYAWYRLINNSKKKDGSESLFAMVTFDFKPKAPYVTFNMLTGLYRDATFVREVRLADDLWAYRFERGDEARICLWNASDAYLKRDLLLRAAPQGRAELVDLFGNRRELKAEQGLWRVPTSTTPVTLVLPKGVAAEVVRTDAERRPRQTVGVKAGVKTWQTVLSAATADRVKILVPEEPSMEPLHWRSQDDLSFSVAFHADSLKARRLKLQVQVRDDVPVPNEASAEKLYRGDSLQLKFLFSGQREPWEIGVAGGPGDAPRTFVWSAPDGIDRAAAARSVGLKVDRWSKKNRHFTLYTVSVPYEALGVGEKDLTSGFLFNVIANDNDGTRRESQMFLAGDVRTGPESWPMVKFEEAK